METTRTFDEDLFNATLSYIRGGMFVKEAANRAGLSYYALDTWLRHGREILRAQQAEGDDYQALTNYDEQYVFVVEEIEKARSEAEGLMVGTIRRSALTNDDWRAAAWWLERSAPERWGRKDHVTLAGDDDKPVFVKVKFEGDQPIPEAAKE